jgi:hypothetical protein
VIAGHRDAGGELLNCSALPRRMMAMVQQTPSTNAENPAGKLVSCRSESAGIGRIDYESRGEEAQKKDHQDI